MFQYIFQGGLNYSHRQNIGDKLSISCKIATRLVFPWNFLISKDPDPYVIRGEATCIYPFC